MGSVADLRLDLEVCQQPSSLQSDGSRVGEERRRLMKQPLSPLALLVAVAAACSDGRNESSGKSKVTRDLPSEAMAIIPAC